MRAAFLLALLSTSAQGLDINAASLEKNLNHLTKGFDGRVGICVQTSASSACTRPGEAFSLQSVMKLMVGVACLDAVDRHQMKLDDAVTIHKEDLSLYVQPLAKLVGPAGYRTTIGDLVRRAIIDSDSAAVDILMARLGGPTGVQAILRQKGITGIRIDRDERHLQTEIVALDWRPEFVDAAVLDRAIAAVPAAKRQRAYDKYKTDPRDTATPRGMSAFLMRLADREILTPASTEFILQAMAECATFPDRLKAGVAPGWKIAHKTGTSGSWKGVAVATNDVGILTAPDGGTVAVTVFIADTRASSAKCAALMARIASAAIASYH